MGAMRETQFKQATPNAAVSIDGAHARVTANGQFIQTHPHRQIPHFRKVGTRQTRTAFTLRICCRVE